MGNCTESTLGIRISIVRQLDHDNSFSIISYLLIIIRVLRFLLTQKHPYGNHFPVNINLLITRSLCLILLHNLYTTRSRCTFLLYLHSYFHGSCNKLLQGEGTLNFRSFPSRPAAQNIVNQSPLLLLLLLPFLQCVPFDTVFSIEP